jgi:hypothetical protein
MAVAGCQTAPGPVASSSVTTDAYDGRYQITFSRSANDTPRMRQEGLAPGRLQTLAVLNVVVTDGQMRLVSKQLSVAGDSYGDLRGQFSVDGMLTMSVTAGWVFGEVDNYPLRVNALVGPRLITSGAATIRQEDAFTADFAAEIEIKRM